jgi:preprotein translocase subunit SecG
LGNWGLFRVIRAIRIIRNLSDMAEKENVLEKLTPVLLVVTIGLAFAVGILWQKVNSLEGDKKGIK